MNRKILLIVLTLALGLVGAAPLRLARLTIVNKSGMKIEIRLTGKYLEKFYYLRVPEGTRQIPVEQTFTVIPDTYTSSLYYVELWDPVYGNQCNTKGQTLVVSRNVVVIVLPCNLSPVNAGESNALVKYGGRAKARGR